MSIRDRASRSRISDMTDWVVTRTWHCERSVESVGVLSRSGEESRMIVWTGFDRGSMEAAFTAGVALGESEGLATKGSITSAIL